MAKQQVTGKASFQSRDLSQTIAPGDTKEKIAQSPEEIRKKLAARTANAASGPSRFQSKDPGVRETDKAKALTPEELRKNLASRKESGTQGGKAVFQSKDPSDNPNKPR